jgi:hypothetical protein
MKKEERNLKIAALVQLGMMIIFVICLGLALYYSIAGDRVDAAFLLLWCIALEIIWTGVINVLKDRYNDALDVEAEEKERNAWYNNRRSIATDYEIDHLHKGGENEFLVISGQNISGQNKEVSFYSGIDQWSTMQASGMRLSLREAALWARSLRRMGVKDARVITVTGGITIY